MSQQTPVLETSLDVPHSPDRVWALVSDVTNMARWSPQVVRTFVPGGSRLGATMININRRGPLFWPTQAKIVSYEAPRKVAFRIKENYTIWSYTLEAQGDGTRITARREAPQGTSKLSDTLVQRVLGGKENFVVELRDGMDQTLRRIAAELG